MSYHICIMYQKSMLQYELNRIHSLFVLIESIALMKMEFACRNEVALQLDQFYDATLSPSSLQVRQDFLQPYSNFHHIISNECVLKSLLLMLKALVVDFQFGTREHSCTNREPTPSRPATFLELVKPHELAIFGLIWMFT